MQIMASKLSSQLTGSGLRRQALTPSPPKFVWLQVAVGNPPQDGTFPPSVLGSTTMNCNPQAQECKHGYEQANHDGASAIFYEIGSVASKAWSDVRVKLALPLAAPKFVLSHGWKCRFRYRNLPWTL
jgi:hypothetical protein